MDPRYQKFMTVVELGSFSLAAKKLRVTQPAITIGIASLERAIGKRLLVRTRHSLTLTPEGRIVYETARRIQAEVTAMRESLARLGAEPLLHVGFIDSIAHLLYTSPESQTPLTNVEAIVDNSSRIISDVQNRNIDFGIITGQAQQLAPELTVYKLHDEEFVFVSSPKMAHALQPGRIDDWLAFNQDSTTYHHFTTVFRSNGLHVNPTFYSTSMELLKEMAIAGNGTALLPRHFVATALENNLLEVVPSPQLSRPIWIIARKDDVRPGIYEPLRQRLNELLQPKH